VEFYKDFFEEISENFLKKAKFYTSGRTRTITTLLYRLKGMLFHLENQNGITGDIAKKFSSYEAKDYLELHKNPNVRMYGMSEDLLFLSFYNCYKTVSSELFKTEKYLNLQEELETFKRKNYELLKPFLEFNAKFGLTLVDQFLYISDFLERASEVDIDLDESHHKLKNMIPHMYFTTIKAISFSKNIVRLLSSKFFYILRKNILKAVKGVRNSKTSENNHKNLMMFSGHDLNLVCVLSFLNVDISNIKFEFNSEVTFELFEDLHNQFPSSFYVTLKFEGKPIPLEFCNYNINCDLKSFLTFLEENILSHQEVNDYCHGKKKMDL
jgi:hypothetical protein